MQYFRIDRENEYEMCKEITVVIEMSTCKKFYVHFNACMENLLVIVLLDKV